MRVQAHSSRSAAKTDAKHWRRFISSAPPTDDLVEIKRLQGNKTVLRRRNDFAASLIADGRPSR